MTEVAWLRMIPIGLPLLGALAIWRRGGKFRFAPRGLAVTIFGFTGVIALTLFLLNRQYACVLLSGSENCLFDGLATLSLFLLSLVLGMRSLVLRDTNNGRTYILMLLLASAWAGMGLANNLLELLLFLNLFFYVVFRWLNSQGLKFRILVLRDDFRDDSS